MTDSTSGWETKNFVTASVPLLPPANRDRGRFLFAVGNSQRSQLAKLLRAQPDLIAALQPRLQPGQIEMNQRAMRVWRWRHKSFAVLFPQSPPTPRLAPLRTPFAAARSN